MNYRESVLHAEETLTSTGTKTIDVDVTQPISRITVKVRATNPSSRATIIAHPAALVTKIELVDGADTLFSLSGKECQALNHYELSQTPDSEISDGQDETPGATFLLNFGRKLWDKELALDPRKFRNLQLKITHNYLAYCASSTNIMILAKAALFDEKQISPIGFLMSKTYGQETLAGASHKYIYPPVDSPYRRMILEAYLTNSPVTSQIDNVKLDEDTDRRIPFDTDLDEYLRGKMGIWTPMQEHFALRIQTAVTSLYVLPTYYPYVYGQWMQHTYATGRITYSYAERQGLISATNGSYPFMGVAYGYVPHHCVDFPFGDQMDMDDWYDVSKIGKLRFDTFGLASSTAALTLFGQQLRKY